MDTDPLTLGLSIVDNSQVEIINCRIMIGMEETTTNNNQNQANKNYSRNFTLLLLVFWTGSLLSFWFLYMATAAWGESRSLNTLFYNVTLFSSVLSIAALPSFIKF